MSECETKLAAKDRLILALAERCQVQSDQLGQVAGRGDVDWRRAWEATAAVGDLFKRAYWEMCASPLSPESAYSASPPQVS